MAPRTPSGRHGKGGRRQPHLRPPRLLGESRFAARPGRGLRPAWLSGKAILALFTARTHGARLDERRTTRLAQYADVNRLLGFLRPLARLFNFLFRLTHDVTHVDDRLNNDSEQQRSENDATRCCETSGDDRLRNR